MRTECIRISRAGPPSVLVKATVELPEPGEGMVLIRQHAVAVNYMDIYYRQGVYKLDYPAGIGAEAAGIVEACGPSVGEFSPGDRVASCSGPLGAYAEARVLPASLLVRLPDAIGFEVAASCLMKGLTALTLLDQVYAVGPEDRVLIHAVAGGVGSLAGQRAKRKKAQVFGTAGGAEKCAAARATGNFAEVIDYGREDFAEAVNRLTGGKGATVVYDGVGASTFAGSLAALAPRGTLVLFGASSGPIPPIPIDQIAAKSIFLTRPRLPVYLPGPAELRATAAGLFAALESGEISAPPITTLPLEQAAEAHALLEGRGTIGAIVLKI